VVAEKRFKEKYGLLRFVEAGENVRNVGRVDLAFQNGDILSVGISCQKEDDDKLFRSIVCALKDTSGVVMWRETRCKARRNGDSTIRSHPVDESQNNADVAERADAERHMQELLAMEDGKLKSLVETAPTPSRRGQRKGKKNSRPSAPAQSRKSATYEKNLYGTNEESPQDVPNEECPPEAATVKATQPLVAEIPERCLHESDAETFQVEDPVRKQVFDIEEQMQVSSETVSEEADEALDSSAPLEVQAQGGEPVNPPDAHEVLVLEATATRTTGFMTVRRKNSRRTAALIKGAWRCGRLQGDKNDVCEAATAFTDQNYNQESFEEPLAMAPLLSAKSSSCAENSQGQSSRRLLLLHKLGPPPSYPPPPPPVPVGEDIESEVSTTASTPNAATAALIPDVELMAASCVVGDQIATHSTCSARSLLWPDLDDPVAASCIVGDKITSSLASATAYLSCPDLDSIVDAWDPMQPPTWNPMQSKLGLWTGNQGMFLLEGSN